MQVVALPLHVEHGEVQVVHWKIPEAELPSSDPAWTGIYPVAHEVHDTELMQVAHYEEHLVQTEP